APDFDHVKFETVTSLDDRMKGLKSGKYDILPQLEPAAVLDAAIAKDSAVTISNLQGVGVIYLGMDLSRQKSPYVQADKNPFMDIRVRKAMLYGINTRHIVKDILDGFADEATQMVAPTMFGFNPEIKRPQYDPARAKELLAEAG